MISITNETITIPYIKICTGSGFDMGFWIGVGSVFIIYSILKFFATWRFK